MNRLANWMMRLYPARWRRRYGDELGVLLADTGADARVVVDLFRGGVRMQFKTWSFLRLALVLGMVGLILSAAGSLLLPSIYISKATVEITPGAPGPSRDNFNELIIRMETEILSRASLYAIIEDPRLELYREELRTTPLDDVIQQMRNDIRVLPTALPGALGKSATAFNITYTYYDRYKAQQTVSRLIDRFMETSQQIQRTLPQSAGKHLLEVLDTPNLPIRPAFPNQRLVELVGVVLGLSIVAAYRKLRGKSLVTWAFALTAVPLALLGGFVWDVALMNGLPVAEYRSRATLSVQNGSPEQIRAIAREVLSVSSLTSVVQNPHLRLYQHELKTKSIENVTETMMQHLSITPIDRSGHYFTVSFEYFDRYKAQQTAQALMERLNEANNRLYGNAPDAPVTPFTSLHMAVLDTASLPIVPAGPNRVRIALSGGLAGVIAGTLIAIVRRRWKPEAEIPIDAVIG